MKAKHQPKPLYNTGDQVRLNAPNDHCHGQIGTVAGLSPSTQKKRGTDKQWRYLVNFGKDRGYFAENLLIAQ